MKNENKRLNGVKDLCRKLKLQLDGLNEDPTESESPAPKDKVARRTVVLMEQLKRQLAELSR